MKRSFTRRQFLGYSVLAAGVFATASTPLFAGAKRTAADQVPLGKTGLSLSRLGLGTGSNNGAPQFALGQDGFTKLVHYAYDHGITYIDCAQSYRTFNMVGAAIKGLPREKLFLQSKVMGQPKDVLQVIDNHRKVLGVDCIDSLLVHCMTQGNWTDDFKRVMEAFDQAQEKKWIRLKGVSCHTLPALRSANKSEWPQVHLVRVNPQGRHIDGERDDWNATGVPIDPVLAEVRQMRAKGRGIIGMKICGNGDFTNPDDREKSIRFAMAQPEIDAVVIGFKSTAEIDEAIERINRALADSARPA
jgi:predicted aldo/keto reductase-like oxidoreductase